MPRQDPAAVPPPEAARYVLRLYVSGATPHCLRAIANIRQICETHLRERYELKVIDIAEHPGLAAGEQIVAAPTLVKHLPLPLRRFIGDMSQTERLLLGLDLLRAPQPPVPAARG